MSPFRLGLCSSRRRLTRALLVLGTALTIVGATSTTTQAAPKTIVQDAALAACIRHELRTTSSEPLTKHDLARLTDLNCGFTPGQAPRDLTGLENATNLLSLDLYCRSHRLRAVDVLEHLTGLRQLGLEACGITDVSALRPLDRLRRLDLLENSITSLAPLGRMPRLRLLSVPSNALTSLEALSQAPRLRTLDARYNQIRSVAGLADLSRLKRLDLSVNAVRSVKPLRDLTQLTHLAIGRNKTKRLGPLRTLDRLVELDVSRNPVSNLAPLTQLKSLTVLDVSRTKATDFSVLARSTSLRDLTARRLGLTDLRGLTAVQQLTHLNVSHNQITDLSGATSLPALTTLIAKAQQLWMPSTVVGVPAGTIPTVVDAHGKPLQVAVSRGEGTVEGDQVTWSRPWSSALQWTQHLVGRKDGVVHVTRFDGEIRQSVSHATLKRLRVRAKGRPTAHRKVRVRIKASKRLTNGWTARGRVKLYVDGVRVRKRSLAKFRANGGKVTLTVPRRLVREPSIRLRAKYVPRDPRRILVDKKKDAITVSVRARA